MKATGIVRRIDDLGRVVIPKEIRRTMRIREGEIIFKKYSPLLDLSKFATEYVESLFEALNVPTILTDRDEVLAVMGFPKKGYLHRQVSTHAEELMSMRKINIVTTATEVELVPGQIETAASFCSVPILVNGDVVGAIYLISKEKELTDYEIKCAEVAALFIGKQMD